MAEYLKRHNGEIMKKIIVLLLIAAVSLVAALTASGSGFLDLRNTVRYILFSVSAAFALLAAILAIRKKGGENRKKT